MAVVPLYVRLNDTKFVINNEHAAQVIIDLTMSFAKIPAVVNEEHRIKTVRERQVMSGTLRRAGPFQIDREKIIAALEAIEVKPPVERLYPPPRGDNSCRCQILPVRRGPKSP